MSNEVGAGLNRRRLFYRVAILASEGTGVEAEAAGGVMSWLPLVCATDGIETAHIAAMESANGT